jgi:ppGpp synthetase/RelA/SpoT-type nucleotidyltranferase
MTDKYFDKFLSAYAERRTLYSDYSLAIRNILEQLLADQKFKVQHITHREKSLDRLKEKLTRKNEEGRVYKQLNDIEDLAGVRIVFYLESEKERFRNFLYEEFRSVIKTGEEKYKRGGYRATHLILELDKKRANLTEYSRFAKLKCELQITSSLYHAWSEVEHDITYKHIDANGKPLKELGLDELQTSFEKVMEEHIQIATHQLDFLQQSYKEIVQAGAVFGSNIIEEILGSESNDIIHSKLEAIEKYLHKKPEEALGIIKAILSRKHSPAIVIHKFGDEEMLGKSHIDLVMKCIGLIERLRYSFPDECLHLLSSLIRLDDPEITSAAKKSLEKLAKYDFNLLTKTNIGYGIQIGRAHV